MESYQTLKTLLLTEKGTRLSETENKYLFKVDCAANKDHIRTAVEELFNVHVTKVNVMNRRGKKKRMRSQKFGQRPDWKRAVVTLRDGETIDLT